MDEPIKRRQDPNSVLARLPKPQSYRIKIISIGAENTGKSCLIKRFCEERFIPKYIATIGIDYGVKKVTMDEQEVRVNFWDLAGGAEYFDIRNEFYKDAQGAILVYDVTNQKSFQQLDNYLTEATKFGAKAMVIVVCANKTDLGKRVVSEAEGKKWASQRGFGYFETSANTGVNVLPMFTQLFRDAATFNGVF